MDRPALAAIWEARFNIPAPKASSRMFLLRALSYERQSQKVCGLSKTELKTFNHSIGKGSEAKKRARIKAKPRRRVTLVPGARLVREWNGQPYTVSVIKEGFVYKDRVWSSLSAIAKDITGAHWSGPRFFGLV